VTDERPDPDLPVEGRACDPLAGDALGVPNDGVLLPLGAPEPANPLRPDG
jgi:hypothetical protein